MLKPMLSPVSRIASPTECEVIFDRATAFQLFALFMGDIERTAHALNVRPVDVLKVADDEGWLDKLKPIIALKKSSRPGDVERAMNRALNFVQAHQMRIIIDRVARRLFNMSVAELDDYIFTVAETKDGVARKLNTRALADLASAAEKAQALSYMALNDTTQERVKRKSAEDLEESASDIHQQIAKAMQAVGASTSPRAALFDAQLEVGNSIVNSVTRPVNPLDNDEH